jgi:hypothetical protein
LRNATTDGVRHFLVADFWNHTCALNLLLDYFWAPDTTANRAARALNLRLGRTAGIAGIGDALSDDGTRNVSRDRFPFTAADIDTTCFGHRPAHCVADVAVTGLTFRPPCRVAFVTVAGLVTGFADFVAHCAVAGLVAGFANVVADVSVTRLVAGLANIAGHRAITRFHHRLADSLLNTAILCLVHRLAYCVALISVTGVVHISDTLNRHILGALIVDCLHACVLLLFHDNFSHCAILRTAVTFRCSEISAFIAGLGGAARKTACSAQPGH